MFPLPEPFRTKLCTLMDEVSKYTKLPVPYKKLPPHVTFHRPIEDISELEIKNITRSMALQTRQTRITISHLYPFGKQYIVLPVHSTRSLSSFWIGLNNLLVRLPKYRHSDLDDDNTLHITVAEKTSSVFNTVWPQLQSIYIEPMTIPVEMVELYRKEIGTDAWEKVKEFQIPKK